MIVLLWCLLQWACAEEPTPDAFVDPAFWLAWNGDNASFFVEEPDGWKLQRDEHSEVRVRWALDDKTYQVNRRYLTKVGVWIPVGQERFQIESALKICRRDLCRTAEIRVSGQVDPAEPTGQVQLEPADWVPPAPPSLDDPDLTGDSAAVANAIAAAQAEGRIPLLYFWSEGCPPCDRLKAGLASRPPAIYTERFTLISVDVGQRHLRRWGVAYGSLGTPTLVAVGPTGDVLGRYSGYAGIGDLRRFLEASLP